ncbi:MAG: gamma carbonic anhydrase family protein [Lachnospiraceae bacterium]|nr:gamma carbonic anhydrase family protein [Lachnospiraceae bacterium]
MIKTPHIHESAFIAPGVAVYGDVTVGADCSIWFNATVRAEGASISVGEGSNIQDNCVVHVDPGHAVELGRNVTIGHGAILHGCRIGDNTLVGMGAIILNDAVIGKNCIIGAGALVTQNTIVQDNCLLIGSPAKVKRKVTEQEVLHNLKNAQHYIEEGKEYAAYFAEK